MTTTVRTLSQAYPDAAATSPITIPSAAEIALYSEARVKNWWRAEDGFDATNAKWRCRKTDAALVPTKGSYFPSRIVANGQISGIAVGAGGTGYTTAPTVTIAAPPTGGTQALATATVSGGAVTAITVINPGSGYTSAPAVSFGGPGTGATATASYTTSAKYNGKQVLQFGNGAGTNGAMYDGGLNLLPINVNFTVVVVYRPGPGGDAGYLWGNGLAPLTTAGGIGQQINDSVGSVVTQGNTGSSVNILNTGTSTWTQANGPFVSLFSFDDDGNTAQQQLSPGAYSASNNAVSASLRVTNGEFHVGDVGPIGSTLSAANYLEGGSVAEIILFNVALHLSANATLLSSVQSYLAARYGLTVP